MRLIGLTKFIYVMSYNLSSMTRVTFFSHFLFDARSIGSSYAPHVSGPREAPPTRACVGLAHERSFYFFFLYYFRFEQKFEFEQFRI
jgi:hypothetical protein